MTYISRIVEGGVRLASLLPKGLVRFLMVGVGGLMVDLATLTTCEALGAIFPVARGVALVVATCFTWALNRRFTFEDSGRKAHHEALRYFLVAGVAQSVNYVVSLGVASVLPQLIHQIDAFIGAVAATLFSYSGQRFFTFAPKSSAGAKAPTNQA
jgi:putative flippase GtrA